jgi:ABC-type transport system involved in multi-copper enzyme maturation permease subunit
MTTARRWQVYAGRALLVTGILLGLTLVWLERFQGRQFTTFQQLAEVGSTFFYTIMAVELVLALMVVPAATAGAICQDKMRGGLTLMMVTDLSDAEIVLGRFASRQVTVLGVVACGLPVLGIAGSLGGVDPGDAMGGSMVIVGVAVLGVAVSMAFSVWATKPHEALMATYAIWAVWLLAALAWEETVRGPTRPNLLYYINPFWLLFGPRWGPPASILLHGAIFLAGCLAISVALALISTWRIRRVTLRQMSRAASRRGPDEGLWRRFGVSEVALDRNPVLWRERHRRRSSGWGRAIWRLYAVLSSSFTLLAIFVNDNIAPGVGAFMVSIGLLMVSVTSATALAEERSLGSLDVLMATPVSTREIVLGKWWGAFRVVPGLAILPGMLAFGTALARGHGVVAVPFSALSAALVLAYGAVVTSLGLALATWQPRLGRAIGSSVAAYLAVALIYPAIVLVAFRLGPDDVVFLWLSPFFGMFIPMGWFSWRFPSADPGRLVAMAVWVALASAFACGLLQVTLANFDRFLGRTPELPGRFVPIPAPKSSKAESAAVYSDWS